jgi:hypothetical protein
MSRALYCYFGRFDDHDLDVPGHPLYQLFFIKSLARKFGIKEFDIYFYDKYDRKLTICHSVLKEERSLIQHRLIRKYDIGFDEAMDKDEYDIVFLKYRFLNYSRIVSGSFDKLKFDKLYEQHKSKAFIIDTDAEVKEPFDKIITLFASPDYKYADGAYVVPILPVLKEDMLEAVETDLEKKWQLTFIGNEYFKERLPGTLKELELRIDLPIIVQGKWKQYDWLKKIIPRVNRREGYETLKQSICTVQISKPSYLKYDFMSPRIFESLLLGTIAFSENSFMSHFSRYRGIVDLCERIKLLKTLSMEQYRKILIDEIYLIYNSLEKHVHKLTV